MVSTNYYPKLSFLKNVIFNFLNFEKLKAFIYKVVPESFCLFYSDLILLIFILELYGL